MSAFDSCLILLAILACTCAFQNMVTSVVRRHDVFSKPLRSASTSADVDNLVLSSLFNKVNTAFGLKLTDFTEVYNGKDWKEGEWSGSTEWWDESKGSKLTGVSKNVISGPDGIHSATLNVWMGPGYLVPHLLLTVGINPKAYSGVSVTADYVVRGATPIGSDQTYVETFYGQEALKWYDSATSSPGAVHLPPSASFSSRLLRSPLHLSVGGLSSADADKIATEHVDRFLHLISEAKQVEARQRGAINARDDKLRQFYYRAATADAIAAVGKEFGTQLGACSTGPVAEAYIGGGS